VQKEPAQSSSAALRAFKTKRAYYVRLVDFALAHQDEPMMDFKYQGRRRKNRAPAGGGCLVALRRAV
jgi:hypothetical protein